MVARTPISAGNPVPIVAAINAVQAQSRLLLLRRVGAIVLDGVFGGHLDRTARKDASYRAVARHPALAMSASTLWRAVAIEAQCRALPRDLVAELTLAQHRALLPVTDLDQKRALARLAVDHAHTAEEIEARVAEQRPRRGGGRPPIGEACKAVRLIERAIGRIEATELGPSVIAELDTQIARLQSLRRAAIARTAAAQAIAK